jgi:hypothetical protein
MRVEAEGHCGRFRPKPKGEGKRRQLRFEIGEGGRRLLNGIEAEAREAFGWLF